MLVLSRDDERCQPGAMIRSRRGRYYEVIGRETATYQNYGLLGGLLGRGLFVAFNVPEGCVHCQRVNPQKKARRGDVGWLSPEAVSASQLVTFSL